MSVKLLKFKPVSPKLKILYRKSRYKVLYGGRASGKSFGIGEALIHLSNSHKIRILCIREIQKSIKESSLRLLVQTIDRLGLTDNFEVLKTEIRNLMTGSIFLFEGLGTNPDKIKSLVDIDICWFEEAQQGSQESFDVMIPTIREKGSEIWLSYNPRLPSDPVSIMFQSGTLPPGTLIEKMNYYDNPMISDEILKEIEHLEKINPDAKLHIYDGDFQQEGDDLFISLKSVIAAQRRKTTVNISVPTIAGLDVARYGNDRSCLVIRKGSEIKKIYLWSKLGTIELHKKVVTKVIEEGIDVLITDGGGVGGGISDLLYETYKNGNITTIEYNSSNKPKNSKKYLNKRAEVWDSMKEWLAKTGKIPLNTELEGQLSTIKYFINAKEQIQLESKDDMKKRGVKSPDIADALSMTFDTQTKDNKKLLAKLYGTDY